MTSPRVQLRSWRSNSSTATVSSIGSTSSVASSAAASASTSKLSISISEPSTSNYLNEGRSSKYLAITPGSRISGVVTVSSFKDAKKLSIILVGKCGCTVMGKSSTSSVIGPSAGIAGAVPVMFREVHCFLNMSQTLWTEEDKSTDSEFPFSIDVPRLKQCACPAATYTLPPTVDLRMTSETNLMSDRSTIEIHYSISAILERKGFLRRNSKAKIRLAMVDDSPPDYLRRELLVQKARGPLKYASDTGDPPLLECELSFCAPSVQGAEVPYTLTYRLVTGSVPMVDSSAYDAPPPETDAPDFPPLYVSPSNPLLAQVCPRVDVMLLRSTKTRPVEKASQGVEYVWPGYALCIGKNETVEEESFTSGTGSVRGSIQMPRHEYATFTCSSEVRHKMHARVMSHALLRPILLTIPVYLPCGG